MNTPSVQNKHWIVISTSQQLQCEALHHSNAVFWEKQREYYNYNQSTIIFYSLFHIISLVLLRNSSNAQWRAGLIFNYAILHVVTFLGDNL